jgi:hypothetical protein
MNDAELTELTAQAFVFGFPLVFDLEQVERFTSQGMGALPAAPLNAFAHATRLAGPHDTFVSINNDTVYSLANVDVSGGPVRLRIPDADGRYYVLQLVDAWTNNFAYVGHRATGTEAGTYLLVAPGWDGTARDGETVIRMPTDVASIVGRWAVDGEDDLAAVRVLQQGLTLEETGGPGRGLPEPAAGVSQELLFLERLRVGMAAFPPATRDAALVQRLAPLGLTEAESPYAGADPARAAVLARGLAAGREQLEAALKGGRGPSQNGWQVNYHMFDYNLDFFEVGALDDPECKLRDTDARYVARAVAARAGLWGNHAYEAAYAFVFDDGDGAPLDGTKVYRLTFATPPPVGAFWSVTMYDLPEFYLVDNPIDRYSIGDRTPGLVWGEDGSLTLVLQRDEPTAPAERANWLPTSDGPFRPILRMYEPEEAVLDGRYVLPPIVPA